MIAIAKETQTRQPTTKKPPLTPNQKRISAHWSQVNGKLICRWITV